MPRVIRLLLAFLLVQVLCALPGLAQTSFARPLRLQISALSDDDLRGGNSASVQIVTFRSFDPLGPSVVFSTGAASNVYTVSTVVAETHHLSRASIRGITISHDGRPRDGHPWDNYDTWSIRRLTISTIDANGSIVEQLYNSAADSAHVNGLVFNKDAPSVFLPISPGIREPDFTISEISRNRNSVTLVVGNVGPEAGILTKVECHFGRSRRSRQPNVRIGSHDAKLIEVTGLRGVAPGFCKVAGTNVGGGNETVTRNNVLRP